MKRILIATTLLLCSIGAYADDWYVDATTGNDTTGDGSSGAPYATINKAITEAAAYADYVYVKSGTAYTELVDLSGKTIDIIGYTSTITDGGQFTIDAEDTRANGILEDTGGSTEVSISNAIIVDATGDGINTDVRCFFYNVVVSGCGGDGFVMDNPNNAATFVKCSAYNNTTNGFDSTGNSAWVDCFAASNGGDGFQAQRNSTFMRCVAADNTGDGFDLSGGDDYTKVVSYCTADANGGDGFYMARYGPCLYLSCVATRNGDYGFDAYSGTSTIIHFTIDCYYGASGLANTGGGIRALINDFGSSTISTSPWTDPYADPGNTDPAAFDYRLSSDSDLFDVLSPVGDMEGTMQAYTSIGPKVQNSAGGSGAIIIAPRRHGN